jgi:ABC-type lipoprotein release transport system permease subunit
MFLKLAWRNLWRNKRRTLISISSVAFAVLFSAVISSFQKGTWDHMVDNIIRYYLGYAQVHHKGYWDDQSLENTFEATKVPLELAGQFEVTPRLESFALASTGTVTRGVLVAGIDPATEDRMTGLSRRLISGNYIEANDEGALLAEGLAKLLNLKIGDTLVLVSQGYQGSNAAGMFPVKGIVKFGAPDLNKQLLFLSLPQAQYFYGTGERLTSLAVNLKSRDMLPQTVRSMRHLLPEEQFEIKDYKELMPELMEAQELDTASAMLILWVLYALIAFGLFGTILMMTRERSYEFGVLTAIGTKRSTLSGMLFSESMFIGLLGAILGIGLSIPICWWLYTNPIQLTGQMASAYEAYGMEPVVKGAFEFGIFVKQAIIIFIISALLSLYSLWYVLRLNPIKAMRQ